MVGYSKYLRFSSATDMVVLAGVLVFWGCSDDVVLLVIVLGVLLMIYICSCTLWWRGGEFEPVKSRRGLLAERSYWSEGMLVPHYELLLQTATV